MSGVHGSSQAKPATAASAAPAKSAATGTTSGCGDSKRQKLQRPPRRKTARKAQEEKAAAEVTEAAPEGRRGTRRRRGRIGEEGRRAKESRRSCQGRGRVARPRPPHRHPPQTPEQKTMTAMVCLKARTKVRARPGWTRLGVGSADDLKMIKGVGPKLEQAVQFPWLLALRPSRGLDLRTRLPGWMRTLPASKGRVSRDKWVEQAKTLASGGETEFSKRVEDGDVY